VGDGPGRLSEVGTWQARRRGGGSAGGVHVCVGSHGVEQQLPERDHAVQQSGNSVLMIPASEHWIGETKRLAPELQA